MADKQIILDLQINQGAALKNITDLGARIDVLKQEQLELAKSTGKNTVEYKAYQAQITSLTKEQKSLENAVSQSTAAFNFEAGSIAANRAELSKLTAEYKNIANPTKAQTKAIKDLSDKLKDQEAAIGNTSRNVGNYTDSLSTAIGQNNIFGSSLGKVGPGFDGLKKGLGAAQLGFTGLKGAIAATGIGALVLILGTLISYFTGTDKGADRLTRVLGGLGAIFEIITKYIGIAGEAIFDFIEKNIELIETVARFIPGMGLLIDTFGDVAKEAYQTGVAIAKLQEDIDDLTVATDISNAKLQTDLEKTLRQIKNKTNAYEESVGLIKKASDTENQILSNSTKLIDLQLSKQKLIFQNQARDRVQAGKDFDKLIAGQISAQDFLQKYETQNVGKQAEVIAGLIIKREEANRSAINLEVKLDNELDKLSEKEKARKEKALKDEQDKQAKLKDLRDKALAEEERILNERIKLSDRYDKAEQSLTNSRLQRNIKSIDQELSQEGISNERRVNLLKKREKALQDAEIESMLQKLDNQNLLADEQILIQEETAQKLIDIKSNTDKEIKKIDDDAKKAALKAESDYYDQLSEFQKKAAEERKAQINEGTQYAQQAADFLSQQLIASNQKQLDQTLSDNESNRARDLKSAGNDKDKQVKINAKYDKIKQDAERSAKKKQLDLQIVTAIADGIAGVVKTLNSIPYPASLIPAGLLAATTVANVSNLNSQKSKLAKGGLLVGPSHASGGITGTGRFANVEVEGGERVINKRSSSKFAPLLEAINSWGVQSGGVSPFYQPNYMADGGLISSQAAGSIPDQQAQTAIIQDILTNLPPTYVRVQDINASQGRLAEVKDLANVTKG